MQKAIQNAALLLGCYVISVDEVKEKIVVKKEPFELDSKTVSFDEFIEHLLTAIDKVTIECVPEEQDDGSYVCFCNWGDHQIAGATKVEAVCNTALFFLEPKKIDKYKVFVTSVFEHAHTEMMFNNVSYERLKALHSAFPRDNILVFKIISKNEMIEKFNNDVEVLAFYDDGTEAVIEDPADFLDNDDVDFGVEQKVDTMWSDHTPVITYVYCINEGSCIHRRGCRRWVGNLPDKTAIDISNEHYTYILDEMCQNPENEDELPFQFLDRFRSSIG